MADIESGKCGSPHTMMRRRELAFGDLWKSSGRNSSLMTSYFFPKYPGSKPLSLRNRPFNMALMYLIPYSYFTLRGSRQIGKTVTIGVRIRTHSEIMHRYRTLYVAPHQSPLDTFSRKYAEISRSFINPVVGSRFKQNMMFLEYPNGSTAEFIKIMSSAVNARGKTSDEIIFDEVQLFDPSLEVEVDEVLNDSDFKIRLYTGTSTTTDTLLEQRYLEGTQGTWHIIKDDGSTINCGDPEEIIPCIGPYYMLDPKTQKRLDPLQGFYRYGNPEAFAQRRYSVHIPQILNPKIANNPLEWSNIHRALVRDKKKFIQEKLGIPVEEADAEVTKTDIMRICCNPDSPATRLEKARKRYYKQVVSAFDWGGSDYEPMTKTKISHTVHSILGVAPDNKVDILHIRRHGGKDYKVILNDIVTDHHRFGAGAMASDFGGGQTYHMLLRSHALLDASRHVVFDYDDPDSPLCATPKKSSYPNMLMLNRTESLTMLFMAIVAADPILRAPSWDEMEDYLTDFLNMKRVLTDSEKGIKGRRFVYRRHAAKSDDVVHSLNLGFALLMLCNNQALVLDQAARNLIRHSAYGSSAPPITAPSGISNWASALSEYAQGR
jgi:hypothetical protein